MDNQPLVPPTQFQAPRPGQMPLPQQQPAKQKRTLSYLVWILVLILLIAIGLVYVWQNQKVKNLNKKVASLNSQVINSGRATTGSSKDYLNLYKYGVKIPLSSSIDDLYYVDYTLSGGGLNYDVLSFSTQSLGQTNPSCWATPTDQYYEYQSLTPSSGTNPTEMGPSPFTDLVAVSKTPLTGQLIGATTTSLGHINGYYFYTIAQNAESSCAGSSSTAQALVSSLNTPYMAALKSIQAIN
jgi:hypothetical protein